MIYIVLFKFHNKLFITYQIQIFSSVKCLKFYVKENTKVYRYGLRCARQQHWIIIPGLLKLTCT